MFHDDQHGTAIVCAAGLINAAKLRGKKPADMQIVINGAGAAANAIARLLLVCGFINITVCDKKGAIYKGRENLDKAKHDLAEITNKKIKKGSLSDVIKDADVFIGVSAPNVLTQAMIKSMAKKPVIFAMANPVPEIMPEEAKKAGAYVIATGRSDFKNQINNLLAFPGVFRGAFDAKAAQINEAMKIAAALAIANLVRDDELCTEYIIPAATDKRVCPAVSKAVFEAAQKTGVCRK